MAIGDQQKGIQPMCPQYWAVFAVPGGREASYSVWFDDPLENRVICTCPAFKFSGRITCKHIDLLWTHGCFSQGVNDLGSVGIRVQDTLPAKLHRRTPTDERCRCGQIKWRPDVRMVDALGRQLVRVRFDDRPGASQYTYAISGAPLQVGARLRLPGYDGDPAIAVVVGLGSDYAGELTVIRTAT